MFNDLEIRLHNVFVINNKYKNIKSGLLEKHMTELNDYRHPSL